MLRLTEEEEEGGKRLVGSAVSGGDSHGYGWTKSLIKLRQRLESPEMSIAGPSRTGPGGDE